jgi:hypothetical protein
MAQMVPEVWVVQLVVELQIRLVQQDLAAAVVMEVEAEMAQVQLAV